MEIVLVDPEIPQNAGCIARMCAATGNRLHLAGKVSFSMDDRYLKRAGLDYWPSVCVGIHRDLDAFLDAFSGRNVFFFTKKAGHLYTETKYTTNDVFVFGSESSGLSHEVLERFPDQLRAIPIRSGVRSLNLSGAVHVVVFHAMAQNGFEGIL